ncbi:hypothetical protein D9613_008203 [Agrocybe pediades]|uniref:Uncharacterized protein n=1 Tax=Agrocybe pediades TaxID=84607 RepID=A0A8H4VLM7_9AGAR|nr:hypothetical protein D9613_008203 [Agrocybe pediades]
MSLTAPRHHMPPRGAEDAPIFDKSHPRSLLQYLTELRYLFEQYNITDDQQKKSHAVRYLDYDTWELWQCLPEFSDPSASFYEFILALYDLYPDCLDAERYSFVELEDFVRKTFSAGIHSLSDLGNYHRQFLTISSALIKSHRLSDLEEKRLYILGFDSSLRSQILDRLYLQHLDQHPDVPFDVQDVYQAAQFVLRSHLSSTESPPVPAPNSTSALPPAVSSTINSVNASPSAFLQSIPTSPPGLSISEPTRRINKAHSASLTSSFALPIVNVVQPSISSPAVAPESPKVVAHPTSVSNSSAPSPASSLVHKRPSSVDMIELHRQERLRQLEDQVHSLRRAQESVFNQQRIAFVQQLRYKSQDGDLVHLGSPSPSSHHSPSLSTISSDFVQDLSVQTVLDRSPSSPSIATAHSISDLKIGTRNSSETSASPPIDSPSLSVVPKPDSPPHTSPHSPSSSQPSPIVSTRSPHPEPSTLHQELSHSSPSLPDSLSVISDTSPSLPSISTSPTAQDVVLLPSEAPFHQDLRRTALPLRFHRFFSFLFLFYIISFILSSIFFLFHRFPRSCGPLRTHSLFSLGSPRFPVRKAR